MKAPPPASAYPAKRSRLQSHHQQPRCKNAHRQPVRAERVNPSRSRLGPTRQVEPFRRPTSIPLDPPPPCGKRHVSFVFEKTKRSLASETNASPAEALAKEDNELMVLNILYQKRHILAHNEGIVDQQYLNKSGDSSYKEGQRIVVSGKDIESLLLLIGKLSEGIKDASSSTHSSVVPPLSE